MRYRLIIVTVLLAAALAYLLNISSKESLEVSITNIPQQQEYDYYMKDIDSTHFAVSGQAEYRIQAQFLTHYPTPDFAVIDSPDLIIYRDNELPWFITADNGRIENNTNAALDKVDLSDNVVIRHIDKQGQALNIYTEFLTVYPSTKKISTDRDILLESANSSIFSTGMLADLNLNQIDFLSNLRGIYEQTSPE